MPLTHFSTISCKASIKFKPSIQVLNFGSEKQVFITLVGYAELAVGWPTAGGNFGSAVPSVPNALEFWYEGSCAIMEWGVNVFIFEAFDETWKPPTSGQDVETHWGVWTDSRVAKYNLTC
jgi:exo-beta-1,3-glucanase (GH17 family)